MCPVRSNRRIRPFPFAVDLALALTAALGFAGAAIAAEGPIPVSPGGVARTAVVEARCPTFHWAGVPGAGGYELAVFQLPDHETDGGTGGAEPVLVTRASVPGDARGFTPSSADCLERGRRYAWSVAAAQDAAGDAGELRWSPPFLFEVGAAPSLDEVEQAIATLQRYRDSHPSDDHASAATVSARAGAAADLVAARSPLRTRLPRTPSTPDSALPGALATPTSGIVRVASAATPSLGDPSLRVSANVALGASSNLFKNDQVFLWDDDASGNTALGRNALASASGTATNNTAVGRDALRYTVPGGSSPYGSWNTAVGDGALRTNTTGSSNTASGYRALFSNTTGFSNTASGGQALRSNTTGWRNTASGYWALFSNTTGSGNTASGTFALESNTTGAQNTASGYRALESNTTGARNTASGDRALFSNTTGHRNTASGYFALFSNNTGARNTAIGYRAGLYATTGNDNIFVGSGAEGVVGAAETNTIRIGGTSTGGATPGAKQQNRSFINGIRGITTANADAIAVLIDSAGQLGTVSSSLAVKQDVEDLGALADRLLELRPVAFRYKQHAASDPDTPLQFGLIAEEVAEVFPELVVFDQEGRPETVKYHLLSSLLLGEVQRQQAENQRQEAELRAVHARLDSMEKNVREPGRRHGDRRGRR